MLFCSYLVHYLAYHRIIISPLSLRLSITYVLRKYRAWNEMLFSPKLSALNKTLTTLLVLMFFFMCSALNAARRGTSYFFDKYKTAVASLTCTSNSSVYKNCEKVHFWINLPHGLKNQLFYVICNTFRKEKKASGSTSAIVTLTALCDPSSSVSNTGELRNKMYRWAAISFFWVWPTINRMSEKQPVSRELYSFSLIVEESVRQSTAGGCTSTSVVPWRPAEASLELMRLMAQSTLVCEKDDKYAKCGQKFKHLLPITATFNYKLCEFHWAE